MLAAAKSFLQRQVKRDNYTFAPSAAEFAEQVRAEQARLSAVYRRPSLPPSPVTKEFKSWDIIQRQRAQLAAKQDGFILLAEKISKEEFDRLGRRKELPVGSRYFWCLQEAWGPQTAR